MSSCHEGKKIDAMPKETGQFPAKTIELYKVISYKEAQFNVISGQRDNSVMSVSCQRGKLLNAYAKIVPCQIYME